MPRHKVKFTSSIDVLLLVLGASLLVLLTAMVARYSTSWQPLEDSDRLGTLVFFIVFWFPVVFVGLALIVRYIVSAT